MFAVLMISVALATPTAEPPTTEEWQRIEAGEIVVRGAPNLDPPGAFAWVQLDASPDRIWQVLNDPALTASSSSAITSCSRYRDDQTPHGRAIGLHYVLNIGFTEVTYFLLRDLRPDQGWMTWELDPDHESDLVSSTGYYVLTTGRRPDTLLLTYKSQADSGRSIPRWIQQFLTGRALRGYLSAVVRAADAP